MGKSLYTSKVLFWWLGLIASFMLSACSDRAHRSGRATAITEKIMQAVGTLDTTTCASGQIGTYPNCFPQPPAPAASGKQWDISFYEEFDGTTLNLNKLTPCFDWNYGGCTSSFNNGKEAYKPSQVRIS